MVFCEISASCELPIRQLLRTSASERDAHAVIQCGRRTRQSDQNSKRCSPCAIEAQVSGMCEREDGEQRPNDWEAVSESFGSQNCICAGPHIQCIDRFRSLSHLTNTQPLLRTSALTSTGRAVTHFSIRCSELSFRTPFPGSRTPSASCSGILFRTLCPLPGRSRFWDRCLSFFLCSYVKRS